MKKSVFRLCLVIVMVMALGGCRLIHIEEEERKSLEYTVVQQEDIPKEAAALIEEKKEKEFQMTYESQGTLYLIRGYGQQMSGGYSIAVEELSCTSSAVFFKTKLIGPSELTKGDEPSYPYIVVKMDYRDEPVEFL